MAKALYSCPNCGRSVTKVVRKFSKNTMARYFGAAMNFNCSFCEEELVTGFGSEDMIVMTQKQVDEIERQKRFEAFCPAI